MQKTIALLTILILAACGDSSDPLPSGPIALSAEVRPDRPRPNLGWRLVARSRQHPRVDGPRDVGL